MARQPKAAIAALLLVFVVNAAANAASAASPAGAASCSGCHAGSAALPRLAGMEAAVMVKAMQDFRAGKRPATVMDRIAKGFSDEEIQAIAEWYARQR